MTTRLYVVTEHRTSPEKLDAPVAEFLVEANNPAQAIRVKVGRRYSAKAATSSDVARLMKAGFEVEQAVVDESDPANVA